MCLQKHANNPSASFDVAPRNARDHLPDIADAIAAILRYTSTGKAAFDREAMIRDAVCARLIQIGQAAKDAQAEGVELTSLRPEIPWRKIAGMRDLLAHKYALLDKELVWAVVERELPRLDEAVKSLLRRKP